MILYFLRHASAGESKKDPERDERRALDAEGLKQAYLVARLFVALNIVPDAILSSPLKRAAQTASLVANELGYDDRLSFEKSLRPEASWDQFRLLLRRHANSETLILVGHNPNLSHFLGQIVSDPGHRAEIDLKKGGAARVDFTGHRGELLWITTPRLLREISEAERKNAAAILKRAQSRIAVPAEPPTELKKVVLTTPSAEPAKRKHGASKKKRKHKKKKADKKKPRGKHKAKKSRSAQHKKRKRTRRR